MKDWKHKINFSVLLTGILSTLCTATPSLAAEQLSAVFGPLEVSVPLKELEIYTQTGVVTSEFRPYAKAVTPEQLAELRDILQRPVPLSPAAVSYLAYTPTGETILKRLGTVLRTESGQNGFLALRAAFVQAAASPDGLTLMSWLREFPTSEIRVDLEAAFEIAQEAGNLFFVQREKLVMATEGLAAQEASQVTTEFATLPDLRQPGSFSWQVEFLDLQDPSRNRPIPTDLYLPDRSDPAPLVVISHGVGGTRQDFAYLAKHLASYGFAVAVPEHVGSNAKLVQGIFQGLTQPEPREAIDRPLDVIYVLDELERSPITHLPLQGHINLNAVGVIGQSFGGYTALTLAGASLNPLALAQECTKPEPNNRSLNISLLLQCRIYSIFLPPLPTETASTTLAPLVPRWEFRDDRVKAVIAINPFTSRIFGQGGLGQIEIPVMMVSGGNDVVVPPGPEQLYPFTWLKTNDRYLVLMENGTHFSTIAQPETGPGVFPLPPSLLGPDLTIGEHYIDALSIAFMEYYLSSNPNFETYLNAGYTQFLSDPAMPLSLVHSLTQTFLDAALARPSDSK
jgi:predicted dienelactone hydrolase